MEKISRELLIKEVSSRLPYGIKAQVLGWDEEKGEVEVPLKVYSVNTDGYLSFEYNHYSVETVYVEDCRLYLRPMSSMTEKEWKEFSVFIGKTETYTQQICLDTDSMVNPIIGGFQCVYWGLFDKCIDWLLSNHFDFRGLIKKGLALEAPDGMYNDK